MGRTNPTYRDRLDSLEREWQPYRRGLRATHQEQFDHLFTHAREYAHAAGNANHPNPEIPFLLSVLLSHERRLAQLETQSEDDHAVRDEDDHAVRDEDDHAVRDEDDHAVHDGDDHAVRD